MHKAERRKKKPSNSHVKTFPPTEFNNSNKLSHKRISVRGKADACVTSTATAPIQKIIQKKSKRGIAWEACVITHVCVYSSWWSYVTTSFHHSTETDFPQACRASSKNIWYEFLFFFLSFFFTQGDSGWHSPAVNPEWHPWKHHHECGGKVRLQQEEEDVASQCEVDVETIVPACKHSKRSQSGKTVRAFLT